MKKSSSREIVIRQPAEFEMPSRWLLIGVLFLVSGRFGTVSADDQPQWGQKFSRNMMSVETGLPENFDPETGKNIKWTKAHAKEKGKS